MSKIRLLENGGKMEYGGHFYKCNGLYQRGQVNEYKCESKKCAGVMKIDKDHNILSHAISEKHTASCHQAAQRVEEERQRVHNEWIEYTNARNEWSQSVPIGAIYKGAENIKITGLDKFKAGMADGEGMPIENAQGYVPLIAGIHVPRYGALIQKIRDKLMDGGIVPCSCLVFSVKDDEGKTEVIRRFNGFSN